MTYDVYILATYRIRKKLAPAAMQQLQSSLPPKDWNAVTQKNLLYGAGKGKFTTVRFYVWLCEVHAGI